MGLGFGGSRFKRGPDGRPDFVDDCKLDGVPHAASGHHHMAAQKPLFDGAQFQDRKTGALVECIGAQFHTLGAKRFEGMLK